MLFRSTTDFCFDEVKTDKAKQVTAKMIEAQTVILPAKDCAPVAPNNEFEPEDPPMPKAPLLLESWIKTSTITTSATMIWIMPMKVVIY